MSLRCKLIGHKLEIGDYCSRCGRPWRELRWPYEPRWLYEYRRLRVSLPDWRKRLRYLLWHECEAGCGKRIVLSPEPTCSEACSDEWVPF